MTHDNTPSPAAPSNLPAIRHDGWTPQRQAAFLRALGDTHNVAAAARMVGMSRQSAYALRARLKGEPFDKAWQAALLCRFDALAEAAMDRALNGVDVPHYYRGELVGTSRKYDERLTVALLAMRGKFAHRRYAALGDPSHDYASDDFGPLVERVERGPATWLEERRLQLEAMEEDYEEEDEDEGEDAGEYREDEQDGDDPQTDISADRAPADPEYDSEDEAAEAAAFFAEYGEFFGTAGNGDAAPEGVSPRESVNFANAPQPRREPRIRCFG